MAIKTLVFSIPLNYMMYAHWNTMKSEDATEQNKQEIEPPTHRSTVRSEGMRFKSTELPRRTSTITSTGS